MRIGFSRPRLAVAALILVTVFVVYFPALRGGFLWEDVAIEGGDWHYYPFFGRGFQRPLSDLSLRLEGFLWGENPAGFHFSSILLHFLNAIMVFILAEMLLGNLPAALLSGFVFALLPSHVEAVAWVSSRPVLLMSFFSLLSLYSLLRYIESGRRLLLVLGSLCFLLAVLSSQAAMFLPVMIIVWAVLWRKDSERNRLLAVLASLALIAGCYGLLALRGELSPPGGLGMDRIFEIPVYFGYYVEKTVVPYGLGVIPNVPDAPWYMILSVLPFAAAAFMLSERRKAGFFLVAWFVVAILPYLLLVLSSLEPKAGERYMYLPSFGLCLLVSMPLAAASRRWLRIAYCIPIIVLCIAVTSVRAGVWSDPVGVWRDTLQKNPHSSIAHLNYGMALIGSGENEKGLNEIAEAAVQRNVSSSKLLHIMEFYMSSGINYEKVEEKLLIRLLAEKGEAEGYRTMGLAYYTIASQKEHEGPVHEKAVSFLEKAVELMPEEPDVNVLLGEGYYYGRQWGKAEIQLGRALELQLDPNLKGRAEEILSVIAMLKERGLITID